MVETHPLPSTKKGKKGKKRKRSSKKSSSDSDSGPTPPPTDCVIKGGDGRHSGGSSPVRIKNASKHNASGVKVRFRDYPYPTDYNDHFETPARAYDDIFPLLEHVLAKKKNRGNKRKHSNEQPKGDETILYDPYYCTGRAAVHLNGVFQRHNSEKISSSIRIRHEKRDFYCDVRQKSVPKHDVLITNPPYSGNHKERCLEFAVGQLRDRGRPFFLLMPNYVAMKEYFRKIVLDDDGGSGSEGKIRIFYVAPSSNRSYEYEHPEGTGHEASPFASVWFCGLSRGGGKSDVKSATDAFARFHSSRASSPADAPRIAASLRELISMGGVSGERRKNPRQRRKMRRQAMQRADGAIAAGGAGAGAGGKSSGGSGDRNAREEGKGCKRRRKSK